MYSVFITTINPFKFKVEALFLMNDAFVPVNLHKA